MDIYKDILNKTNDISDLITKEIKVNNNIINIILIETICNSEIINNYLLRKIDELEKEDNILEYFLNNIPSINIKKVKFDDVITLLLSGFTIIILNNKDILAIETINKLTRGITESNYEKTITGPKDSFIEQFNTNVGLIRKRIKSNHLKLDTLNIGKYTDTKIGIMYIDDICNLDLKNKIIKELNKINIDGIIDSSYLKKYLNKSNSLFPTIKDSERPDSVSKELLEGKIIIVTDNSPNVLILPTFFIDYFHYIDDYYQKRINITFIRIIRLISFIIAIFIPSYYIAITTYNVDFIPINLLVNFISQRLTVPFPAFIESFIMIISFEILRESDIRIPSNMGSSVSILGGLVLGEAAVNAGILSPMMIIVVAISAISALLFQNIEVVNAIRSYRFLLIILATIFGLFGIFIGFLLIIINLSDTKSFDKDYLYPFSPINLNEQKDGFIRLKKKPLTRNPILSKNRIRGA